ncbi:MAG: hypothetical protein R3C32_09780 [Chloroflexota bacterium]
MALVVVLLGQVLRLDGLPAAWLAICLGAVLAVVVDAARRPSVMDTALALDADRGWPTGCPRPSRWAATRATTPRSRRRSLGYSDRTRWRAWHRVPGGMAHGGPAEQPPWRWHRRCWSPRSPMPDPWAAISAESSANARPPRRRPSGSMRRRGGSRRTPRGAERDAFARGAARRLAAELRARPEALEDQLARMGALEGRAARPDRSRLSSVSSAVAALSRRLSQTTEAATMRPARAPGGSRRPGTAGQAVGGSTEQRAELTRELSGLDGLARGEP